MRRRVKKSRHSQHLKFHLTVESLLGPVLLVTQPVWIEAQRRGQKVIMASSTSGSAVSHKEEDSSMIVWSAPAGKEDGLVFKPKGKNKVQAVKGGIILQSTMFHTKGNTYAEKLLYLTLRQAKESDSRKSLNLGKYVLNLAGCCDPAEPVSSHSLEIGLGYCSLKLTVSSMRVELEDEASPFNRSQTALMHRLKRKKDKIKSKFVNKFSKKPKKRFSKYQVEESYNAGSEADKISLMPPIETNPFGANNNKRGPNSPLSLQDPWATTKSGEPADDEKNWHIHFDTVVNAFGNNTLVKNEEKESAAVAEDLNQINLVYHEEPKKKKQITKIRSGQDDWFLHDFATTTKFKGRPRNDSAPNSAGSSKDSSPIKKVEIKPLEWKVEGARLRYSSKAEANGNAASMEGLPATEGKQQPQKELDFEFDNDDSSSTEEAEVIIENKSIEPETTDLGTPEGTFRNLGSFQVGQADEEDDFGYSLSFKLNNSPTGKSETKQKEEVKVNESSPGGHSSSWGSPSSASLGSPSLVPSIAEAPTLSSMQGLPTLGSMASSPVDNRLQGSSALSSMTASYMQGSPILSSMQLDNRLSTNVDEKESENLNRLQPLARSGSLGPQGGRVLVSPGGKDRASSLDNLKSPSSSEWFAAHAADDVADEKNLRDLRMFGGVLDKKDKLSEEKNNLEKQLGELREQSQRSLNAECAEKRTLQQRALQAEQKAAQAEQKAADMRVELSAYIMQVSQLQQQLQQLQQKYEGKNQEVDELKQRVDAIFENNLLAREIPRLQPAASNSSDQLVEDKVESNPKTLELLANTELPYFPVSPSQWDDKSDKPFTSPRFTFSSPTNKEINSVLSFETKAAGSQGSPVVDPLDRSGSDSSVLLPLPSENSTVESYVSNVDNGFPEGQTNFSTDLHSPLLSLIDNMIASTAPTPHRNY